MDFTLKNIQQNIAGVARDIGYTIIDAKDNSEYNLVRRLSAGWRINNYPRFHAYVTQQGTDFNFSLHLDQKEPIYKGAGVHAHNGEYFGPVLEIEANRIKEILENRNQKDRK